MEMVSLEDRRYPKLLREVLGSPPALYVEGAVPILDLPMVAVVGSRQISATTREKTRMVVKQLVEMGKVIVSGLARGTDGIAHEAALEFGGKTIAVLAHGLDMIYPPEHKGLAEKIVKRGGALISELSLGEKPKKWYFLERNRIVVGMSEALVVVEAGIQSGTMSSANHAAEMGREVLAIPGTPGTDLLIGEGAIALKI